MNTGEALEWNLVIFVGAVPRTPLGNTLPEEEIENDTSKESFFASSPPLQKMKQRHSVGVGMRCYSVDTSMIMTTRTPLGISEQVWAVTIILFAISCHNGISSHLKFSQISPHLIGLISWPESETYTPLLYGKVRITSLVGFASPLDCDNELSCKVYGFGWIRLTKIPVNE